MGLKHKTNQQELKYLFQSKQKCPVKNKVVINRSSTQIKPCPVVNCKEQKNVGSLFNKLFFIVSIHNLP